MVAPRAPELVGAAADRRAAGGDRRHGARHRVALRASAPARPSGRARGAALSRIAICTDSSSLLPPEDAEQLGVDVVPIAVALDGEPFDERTSSLDELYARLRAGAVATTSLPSPAVFLDAYADASARGADAVVSIHLDARASGTVAAAELAAREASIPVHVVDTRTASYGVALCVRAAAGGGSALEAVDAAQRLGAALENAFTARRGSGGRVPASEAWALLALREGSSVPLSSCAAAGDAVAALAALVPPTASVAVGHAAREVEPAADDLARALEDAGHKVERYRVGAPVGAHTGPDSFGLFWWPATRP